MDFSILVIMLHTLINAKLLRQSSSIHLNPTYNEAIILKLLEIWNQLLIPTYINYKTSILPCALHEAYDINLLEMINKRNKN